MQGRTRAPSLALPRAYAGEGTGRQAYAIHVHKQRHGRFSDHAKTVPGTRYRVRNVARYCDGLAPVTRVKAVAKLRNWL